MVSESVRPDNFASSKLYQQDRYPMHEINQIPPERMTPEQRRREVASLLALGLVRLRTAIHAPSASMAAEKKFELAFSGNQRVHSDPVNKRNTES